VAQFDSPSSARLATLAIRVPPTDFDPAGAVKREAGEIPALCPQL
jgi:hypothetical protein